MASERFRVEFIREPSGLPDSLPAFCSADLLRVTHQAFGGDFCWAQVFAGTEPILGIPVFAVKRGPFTRAFTPPYLPSGGPVRLGEARKHWNREARILREALHELLGALEDQYHQVLLFPDFCDYRVAMERHWKTWPRFFLEHRFGPTSLQFDTDTMRMVRKAEKAGVVVTPGGDWSQMVVAYERTYAKQGLPPPYSVDGVDKYHAQLMRENLVQAYTAQDSAGKTIAYLSVYTGIHQDSAEVAWIGSHPESDQNGSMYLLFYTMLTEWQHRCKTLSFGGADHANVYGFKEHFANALVMRQGIQYDRSALTSLAFRSFTQLRKILR